MKALPPLARPFQKWDGGVRKRAAARSRTESGAAPNSSCHWQLAMAPALARSLE